MASTMQRAQSRGHSLSQQAQIIFKQPGSLYVLAASQWNKLGKGLLSLIFNPHNPRELVFKLKTNNDVHIFQLKPKLKPKGGSSWVLKATNTRTNKEDILAVRFNEPMASETFKQHVEWADKQAQQHGQIAGDEDPASSLPDEPHTHDRLQSYTPSEMRQMLPKQPWDCPLCTFSNDAANAKCNVCSTPRPLLRQESTTQIGSPDENNTPMLPMSLQVGDGQISAIFAPASPNGGFGDSFDFTNTKLPEKPSKDTDVQSTLGDFKRILTMIESNITYQDPTKFFTDLRKVAKRLQRPDMKFRCLDLNNPVVKSRLMQVEGVDAYLSYLGFVKDDQSNKLICPEDQPPQSVISAAQEACKFMIEQAQHKLETLTRIRKFSIQEKRRESQRMSAKANIHKDRVSRVKTADTQARQSFPQHGGGGAAAAGLVKNGIGNASSPLHPVSQSSRASGASGGGGMGSSGSSRPSGRGLPRPSDAQEEEQNRQGGDTTPAQEEEPRERVDSQGLPRPHVEEKESSDSDEKMSDGTSGHDESDEFTLKQLVWSVTHEKSRDDKTQDVLLLSHGVFATSLDLFHVLVERFNKPDENEVLSEEDENDAQQQQQGQGGHWPVQVKVANMLRHWIKSFYEQDFAGTQVSDELYDFFDSMEDHEDAKVRQLLDKLKKTYEQQEKDFEKKMKQSARAQRPGKDLSNVFGTSKKFKLNDQSAQTIAEQITLMDFKIFKEIQKRECLGQSWKKKDGRKRAPNILAMIDQFNRVSKFVQVLILMAPDIRKRCKVIRKCIKIACVLRELRNFSSLCAFNSALISTPIYRLKDAWNVVPQGDRKKFDEIKAIFAMQDNWKTLRRMHREAHAPAILHSGLFLQDIVAIDEGNENKLKNGKVNFKKLLRLYEKIDTIYMYQQAGYTFKENLLIQKVIKDDFLAQEKLDEDYLFRFSTDVREKDKAKGTTRIWR